jgi:hypothetical protein
VPNNKPLKEFSGIAIAEAKVVALRASPDALDWHMKNIVLR